jgi:hypothetical protein
MTDLANEIEQSKALFQTSSPYETGLVIKKMRCIERMLDNKLKPRDIQAYLGITKFECSHFMRISRKLSAPVKDLLSKSKLSLGHARALTRLGPSKQESVARDAIFKNWSVARLEQEARSIIDGKPVNEDNAYYENLGEKISSIIGHPVKVIPDKNDQSIGTIQITYLGYDAFDGIMARMRVKLEDEF